MPDAYSSEERTRIRRALGRGEDDVPCPRCATVLERRDESPRRQVAYVRERLWTLCPSCGRTAVFDRRELERD